MEGFVGGMRALKSAVEGLAIATVLPAGEETLVELPVLQEAAIYRINCHLHPPHRTATLMVAPAD